MKHYLIIHGAYGHPQENWFPWLASALAHHGQVHVPTFPTPEGQNLDAWLKIAETTLQGVSPQNTILIGHSVGAVVALRMTEITDQPYKAVFAVCPFAHDLNLEFDRLNTSFVHPAFDWSAVKRGERI